MPIDEHTRSDLHSYRDTRHACSEGVSAALELTVEPDVNFPTPKPVAEGSGIDPYNTTGRFELYHDWSRIGKRY